MNLPSANVSPVWMRGVSRRELLGMFGGIGAFCLRNAKADSIAGRVIDLRLSEAFAESGSGNVLAVLASAADTIWRHCARTTWNVPGFYVFRSPNTPITLHKHRPDGRVAVGLTAGKYFWCQYAFQFAHEFCHALTGHSNDWRTTWVGDHGTNQWFEEALCETGSLFALHTMSKDWAVNPPFPNWRDFAPKHEAYANERLTSASTQLPDPTQFASWFIAQLESLREAATQREKNLVVARHLLPLFQEQPSGWESLTFLNRVQNRDPRKSFATHLSDWMNASPPEHAPFLLKLREMFPREATAL